MKRFLYCGALGLLLLGEGCTRTGTGDDTVPVEIRFIPPATKTGEGQDTLLTDLNLFIFSGNGFLTDRRYVRNASEPLRLRLPRQSRLSLYACANLGIELSGIRDLESLKNYRYYLFYPDGFRNGFPQAGIREGTVIGDDATSVDVPMTLLLSRFSLSMDRTALDPDVKIRIRSARIGGCPNSITPFSPSRAEKSAHLFGRGFSLDGAAVAPLNEAGGRSGTVELFALENLQDGERTPLSTYIELDADYQSPLYYSARDRYLTYRFYAGENYNVERGMHYRYLIRTEGDALNGDDWSVDRSRLGTLEP